MEANTNSLPRRSSIRLPNRLNHPHTALMAHSMDLQCSHGFHRLLLPLARVVAPVLKIRQVQVLEEVVPVDEVQEPTSGATLG